MCMNAVPVKRNFQPQHYVLFLHIEEATYYLDCPKVFTRIASAWENFLDTAKHVHTETRNTGCSFKKRTIDEKLPFECPRR